MAIIDDALALVDAVGTALKAVQTLQAEIPPGAIGAGILEEMRTRLRLTQSDSVTLVEGLGGTI